MCKPSLSRGLLGVVAGGDPLLPWLHQSSSGDREVTWRHWILLGDSSCGSPPHECFYSCLRNYTPLLKINRKWSFTEATLTEPDKLLISEPQAHSIVCVSRTKAICIRYKSWIQKKHYSQDTGQNIWNVNRIFSGLFLLFACTFNFSKYLNGVWPDCYLRGKATLEMFFCTRCKTILADFI